MSAFRFASPRAISLTKSVRKKESKLTNLLLQRSNYMHLFSLPIALAASIQSLTLRNVTLLTGTAALSHRIPSGNSLQWRNSLHHGREVLWTLQQALPQRKNMSRTIRPGNDIRFTINTSIAMNPYHQTFRWGLICSLEHLQALPYV